MHSSWFCGCRGCADKLLRSCPSREARERIEIGYREALAVEGLINLRMAVVRQRH